MSQLATEPSLRQEGEVRDAYGRFHASLKSLLAGDSRPMEAVWSHAADVTLSSPHGGRQIGWEPVRRELQRIAGFKSGGQVDPADLLIRVCGNCAYALCFERGKFPGPGGKEIHIDLRETSIFRHEKGQWRLVHYQADLSPELQQAFPGA